MAKTPKPNQDDTKTTDPIEDGEVVEENAAPSPEKDPLLPGEPSVADEPPAPKEPRRSGGFFALLLGGVAAAVIGFGMARYVVPEGWPFPGVTPEPDPLSLAIEAQEARLKVLEAETEAQTQAISALQSDPGINTLRGEVRGEVGNLQARIQAVITQLSEIDTRLSAVEKLPQGSGTAAAEAAAAAYQRELAQMRMMLEQELARISSAQNDAQTLEITAAQTAQAAAARAALSRVLAALDTGRPFDDALFDLSEAAGLEAPQALSTVAVDGVPTLAALQDQFPAAARAALEASIRSAVESGEIDRFSAFLRTQLGTRSLEPREGDDPDAVLSRAEAALKQGQIDTALAELGILPQAGQAELEAWVGMAATRRDAVSAGRDLARRLSEN